MRKYDYEEVIRKASLACPNVQSLTELAKIVGIPAKSLSNICLDVAEPHGDETIFEAFREWAAASTVDVEVLSQAQELRWYKAKCSKLEKMVANDESWRRMLTDAAGMLAKKPVPVPKPPKKISGKSHHIAMLNIADVHYGAWECSGLGVLPWYNVEIANKAIDTTFERAVSLLKRLEYVEVDALIVHFLGDIVENVILRPGQRRLAEIGVAEQVVGAAYRFAENIRMVAGEFGKVYVSGVPGNHGRVTQKVGEADPWDNFDWLFYQFLVALLSNQPNIEFLFPKCWYMFHVLYGKHVVYSMHGEDVRGYAGYPWYGYGTAVANIAGMMTQETKSRLQAFDFHGEITPDKLAEMMLIPDTCIIAHQHQPVEFRPHGVNAIAVNSMIPVTEFSAKKLRKMTTPSQSLCLFSASWGRLVSVYQIWLDDVIGEMSRANRVDNPMMKVM